MKIYASGCMPLYIRGPKEAFQGIIRLTMLSKIDRISIIGTTLNNPS